MTTFILDFETNGLNPFHDDVIEIAIKIFNSDKSFECLVVPQNKRGLSDKITEVTGITNQILKDEGLNYKEAYSNMISFIQENTDEKEFFYLVAHNGAGFDFLFFKKIMKVMNHSFDNVRYVDSLFLSRMVHPKMYSHSMKTLCKIHNVVNEQEHRAMGDINALEKLMNLMISKNSLNSIENVYNSLEFL